MAMSKSKHNFSQISFEMSRSESGNQTVESRVKSQKFRKKNISNVSNNELSRLLVEELPHHILAFWEWAYKSPEPISAWRTHATRQWIMLMLMPTLMPILLIWIMSTNDKCQFNVHNIMAAVTCFWSALATAVSEMLSPFPLTLTLVTVTVQWLRADKSL